MINEGFDDIIKWNFKKNCKIKISNYNALLILEKQKLYCKNCNKTFTAETELVDYHKQIFNNTNLSIILDLMGKGSEKDISKRNNVSINSTNRILDEISKDKLIKNNGKLPTSFCIDEFMAAKDIIGKMTFIIVDQNKFLSIIHNLSSLIFDYVKKANKTLIKMEKYIVNSFDYNLSHGITEVTINVIKQMKHTACGYKKFHHLKARIMLIKGIYNSINA